METSTDHDELKAQLDDIQRRFPALKADDLFVCWFLRAYLTDDEATAAAAITGGPRDKSVDAVLIDQRARAVILVQGKYRQKIGKKSEAPTDVMAFASLAARLTDPDERGFKQLCKNAQPDVAARLAAARKLVLDGYRLWLYFVTLGSVSAELEEDATEEVSRAATNATLEILDGAKVMHLLRDYLDGVAPPIPVVELEVERHANVEVGGALSRLDNANNIQSWVFSMRGDKIAEVCDFAGLRLYARNIRGFLGKTPVNQGMVKTLIQEPDQFFYYNNGITIICDRAESRKRAGVEMLRVSNPQIINGQQTSRTLAENKDLAAAASVLVKVMQVPRPPGAAGGDGFDDLVARIVANTNWQNAISFADLRSNDRVQIEMERAFRKIGYHYLRKRQKPGEARVVAGKIYRLLNKEDVAKAVAACELDPLIVRQGKNRLFGEHYDHLFKRGQSADFYLCRYWTMRFVSKASRGNPTRGYAKWLVLHFVWSQIAALLRSADAASRYRKAAELSEDTLVSAIDKLVEFVSRAVMSFYTASKGRGPDELDHSSFFKGRNRHKDFREFWKKRGLQASADSAVSAFKSALVSE